MKPPTIYSQLFQSGRKLFCLLIDPEFHTLSSARRTAKAASDAGTDVILIGGSLTSWPLDEMILAIKSVSACPLLLFPGNLTQLSSHADGVLLCSLISGRNPEYLIGNHVVAAPFLKKSGLEIIPTGYMLVGGNSRSSVEYMSNTRAIPPSKTDILIATALAGEQLGLKLIYIEAGSGADKPVDKRAVACIKRNISVPVIAGGGICKPGDILGLYRAGADGVVVGSAVEKDLSLIASLASVKLNL